MTRPRPAVLTHIAIRTARMHDSVEFYRRYAGFVVVHERVDDGIAVTWLAKGSDDPGLVVVLLEMPHEPAREPMATDHLGFAVASREEVDRVATLAKREGLLKYGPVEAGPVVGYIAMVRDPSGNTCEFSFGQPTHPRDLPAPHGS